MRRITFIRSTATCAATLAAPIGVRAESTSPSLQLAALERRSGGRLGVLAIDTADRRRIEHRAFEAFPMCSTFKLLLVASVLSRVDAGKERLDRPIPFGNCDLLDYAPVTKAHAADGSMSIEALCTAAIEQSDNTAANLLLSTVGGPPGVTEYARTLGDRFTQFDRIEPALNEAAIGDPRDTTTPNAMTKDVEVLLLGSALSTSSRQLLESWMAACDTGTACIRAGIPSAWRAGDKTGAGERGTRNDVAILWPPSRAPIVVAAYLTGATGLTGKERDAMLAEVGRVVSSAFS